MLAKSAIDLVSRCYEQHYCLWNLEELKHAFITYVFGIYQEEVVAVHDLDVFHDHLDSLKLTNCRKDFDAAVEDWYLLQYGDSNEEANFHDILFALVKEAITLYQSESREALVRDVTRMLTTPSGFMARWRTDKERTAPKYFRYLIKLGIRTYSDIETLIDMWLIEHPNAFDKRQQHLFCKPSKRGRPNNLELSILIEQAYEIKPELSRQERERIRKIYYYHRKSLTTLAMIEKFKSYILMKSLIQVQEDSNSDTPQAG